MSSLNLTKIITGLNSTIGTINKVVPIYKQVTPIIKNVKSKRYLLKVNMCYQKGVNT